MEPCRSASGGGADTPSPAHDGRAAPASDTPDGQPKKKKKEKSVSLIVKVLFSRVRSTFVALSCLLGRELCLGLVLGLRSRGIGCVDGYHISNFGRGRESSSMRRVQDELPSRFAARRPALFRPSRPDMSSTQRVTGIPSFFPQPPPVRGFTPTGLGRPSSLHDAG